ncbi:hypothetical protein HAX54_033188 [Datura stramonium]|uniref:Uncharacterized protein n=1 Tax=Datura stramonium TaxID=4076 RepID=A0ABS8VBY1_DATST|nr:hypothetical protein [Datura stramonium]
MKKPHEQESRDLLSSIAVFCLSFGGLIAVTFVVWMEDNKGWQWGFGIATLAIFLSIPIFLAGSPFYKTRYLVEALLQQSASIHNDPSTSLRPFHHPIPRRSNQNRNGHLSPPTNWYRFGHSPFVAIAWPPLFEIKRKGVATDSGLVDSAKPLPITFFWIAFQYLFLGSADLFVLAGLLEFCFSEAPSEYESMATSLS